MNKSIVIKRDGSSAEFVLYINDIEYCSGDNLESAVEEFKLDNPEYKDYSVYYENKLLELL